MREKIDENYELAFYSSKPYTFDRFVRMLIAVAIIVGIILVVRSISSVLVPFFFAVILAYLIDPIVDFIQNRVRIRHRGISVFITLVIFISLFVGAFWWLVPRMLSEATNLSFLLKDYLGTHDIEGVLPASLETYLKKIISKNNFQDLINAENVKEIGAVITKSVKSVFSSSLSIITGIIGFLLVLLYLFFILLDYRRLEESWIGLVPKKHRTLFSNIVEDLKISMRVYFRAQSTIAMIVGILMAIGFSIIQLPMAITLGLFIGILNIVPYLQIVGFIPAAFLTLLKSMETGQTFFEVFILVLLVMAIVQVIQETLLVPRIMGKAYNMNPAIILLSLSVWGSIMGILGMLLALPLTTVLISYYKQLILKENLGEPLHQQSSEDGKENISVDI
ncbi:MAG TPA: AI-2E family transporter [Marinilabiliaceae bacterium]|nr:AI-2E family transporter [Marinilabiliaceae bacterium]